MRHFFYLLVALSLSIGSFAQGNNTFTKSLEKLMEANNGSDIFTRIYNHNIQNIKAEKRVDFKQKIAEMAVEKKAEAIKFFTKKYSQKDIEDIYFEYTSGRMDYSPKTTGFIKYWRSFKVEFQQEYKELYVAYQK